ncbi:MAG: plasmid stabilization protein [Ignavibacteriota bacterium]
METDINAPFLATHKLGGKLIGLLACTCGYNCRILFSIETDRKTREKNIILVSVGTHDEMY